MAEPTATTGEEDQPYEPEPEFSEIESSFEPSQEDDEYFSGLAVVIEDKDAVQKIVVEPLATSGYYAQQRAQTQVGVHETPTNCQPYSAWFGVPCAPWCAYFVSWSFDTSAAGNKDHRCPWSGVGSASGIYNWAVANNKLVSTPQTGDMFILKNFSHMGLIRGANTSTKALWTVEGNYSDKVANVSRSYVGSPFYFVRY